MTATIFQEIYPLKDCLLEMEGVKAQLLAFARRGKHKELYGLSYDRLGAGLERRNVYSDNLLGHIGQIQLGNHALPVSMVGCLERGSKEAEKRLAALQMGGVKLSPQAALWPPEDTLLTHLILDNTGSNLGWLKPYRLMRLDFREHTRSYPVEQGFTLTVGRGRSEWLTFVDQAFGHSHSFVVTDVYIEDPEPQWQEEIREWRAAGVLSEQELAQHLANQRAHCPQGWGYPVLVYQTKSERLEFCSQPEPEEMSDGGMRLSRICYKWRVRQQERSGAGRRVKQLDRIVPLSAKTVEAMLLFYSEPMPRQVREVPVQWAKPL